jgi:phospholipase C
MDAGEPRRVAPSDFHVAPAPASVCATSGRADLEEDGMGGTLERIGRALLRGVAHLLPGRLREVVELVVAPIPPTPRATIPAPADAAAARLAGIDHVVVVMLENRSFDHMLGYLSLPVEQGGGGRADVDGLTGEEANVAGGVRYGVRHLDRTELRGEREDPDHSGGAVDAQLDGGGAGFASSFAEYGRRYVAEHGGTAADPGLVMGYYDADDLPVYDHLAREFCVVDRWFSSVPGATWPNRLYAVAGRAAGSRDDVSPPIYALPGFVRHLDERGVDWRWYSFDPATLRAVDPAYRLSNHHRFSYVESRKLSAAERAVGELMEEGPSFLDDVAQGELPAVSWIDPRFKDLRVLGPDSNDDHPPSDVIAGQDLVLTIYHALRTSSAWERTLLIVTYDEHGGFYDHVAPPAAADDDPGFRRLGVRVPALVVSPLVGRGSTSTALLGRDVHFDHTSIVKTILTRFCDVGGRIPAMSARVAAANHLGLLLHDAGPRDEVGDHAPLAERMQAWRAGFAAARFDRPTAGAAPPRPLTEFQSGFYEMARRLRKAGLPGGHP